MPCRNAGRSRPVTRRLAEHGAIESPAPLRGGAVLGRHVAMESAGMSRREFSGPGAVEAGLRSILREVADTASVTASTLAARATSDAPWPDPPEPSGRASSGASSPGTAGTGAICRGAAPRALPHPRLRDHAAADPGRSRHPEVPRVPRALSDPRGLAAAPADDVTATWYPLGYNVRPREPARHRPRDGRPLRRAAARRRRRAQRACAASGATPRAPSSPSPTAGRGDRRHQRSRGCSAASSLARDGSRGCAVRRRCGTSRHLWYPPAAPRLQPGPHGLRRHLVHPVSL